MANKSNNSEKQHISKKVLWTRLLCIFLALLMIGSMAYLAIQIIIQSVNEKKAAAEAAAANTTVETTTTEANTTDSTPAE